MKKGRSGETPGLTEIPGLAGLFALLFFFSVLDPVSLILVQVSSLLFFFADSHTVRGLGFLGLAGFIYLAARTGAHSPDSMAILSSGVVFGLLLRLGRFGTVFYPSLLTGVITLILVTAAFMLFDRDGLLGWTEEIHAVMQDALETSFARIQKTGAFGLEELVGLKSAMSGIVELMMTLIPVAVCLNLLLAGIISIKLFHLFRVPGPSLPRPKELRYFSFNDAFIWGLITGLLSLVLPLPDSIRAILLNVLTLVTLLYLFRGLAVGIFWLRKRGFSMMGIGAAYAFLFALLPPLFIICLLLPGVLDTWYDFRAAGEATKES